MVCRMAARDKRKVRKVREGTHVLAFFFATFATFALSLAAVQQPAGPTRPTSRTLDWRWYAGDLKNHHYSPLDQINATNFNDLEVAWRFKTDFLGPRPEFKLEGTPLAV